MTRGNRESVYNEPMRLLFIWRFRLLLLLSMGMCMSVSAGGLDSQNVEKKARYEQLKLPELVRKANANDAAAQFELGSRFNYGRNAPRNNQEALKWLRRAAQNKHREAQRLLAVKLYNGYDVAANYDEALLWALRLAEAGDVPGQMMVANMYSNGEGGPRDLVRAYMWYDIASTMAQQEDSAVALQTAAVEARDKTGTLLLPDEETKAQELASQWWLRKQGVSLTPRASAKPKGQPSGKNTTGKSAVPGAVGKPKAPEKPKLPGSPQAPLTPDVEKP